MSSYLSESAPEARPASPVTVPQVVARKGGEDPLVMITAYDASSARIADAGGADIILVGDSLGMVILGYDSTLEVTMDDMVRHTAAVTRSCDRPLVIADMPYLSYHLGQTETVRNAGRLIVEGKAKAVKVEGGRKRLPVIDSLLDAEIPVMGHIGLTPQSVNAFGGYKVQGKALEPAQNLIDDAKALAAAGVFSIVLECVPAPLARIVTKAVDVPTIGIGAGPDTDGQVLVYHDLLGLFEGHKPKFVRRFGDVGEAAVMGVAAYADAVRSRDFPTLDESYGLPDDVEAALAERFHA